MVYGQRWLYILTDRKVIVAGLECSGPKRQSTFTVSLLVDQERHKADKNARVPG